MSDSDKADVETLAQCYRQLASRPREEQLAALRWLSARLEFDALVASGLIDEDGKFLRPAAARRKP